MFKPRTHIITAAVVTAAVIAPGAAQAMWVGASGFTPAATPQLASQQPDPAEQPGITRLQQNVKPSQQPNPAEQPGITRLQQNVKQLFASEGGWHLGGSSVHTATVAVAGSNGFHWGDAGLGAAGMTVVLVAGAGAAGALRRRRGRVVVG